MFENLSKKLEKAFKVLKGQGSISEINVAQTMKEIRKALLSADVDFKTAKLFTAQVKEKALGAKVFDSVKPGQQFVKIVQDELISFLSSDNMSININSSGITTIVMAGLQGSGKTTTSAKIASFLKREYNKNPLLIGADLQRLAARDQLKIL